MAGYQQQGRAQQYWQQQGPPQYNAYNQHAGYNGSYPRQVQQFQQQQQRPMSSAAPQHGRQQQQQPYYAQPQPQQQLQQYHGNTPNPRPNKRMRRAEQPPEHLQQQQQQNFQQVQQQQQLQGQRQQQLRQQQQPQNHGAPVAVGQLLKSNHSNPAAAAWLDQLQEQIAAFAARAVPTPQEQLRRDEVLRGFRDVAAQAVPKPFARQITAELFGSGAAGLALHTSDLDIVIQGLAEPDEQTGHFDPSNKDFVVKCLRKVERAARWGPGKDRLGVVNGQLIARARVPVLKLNLASGLEMDVSINGDGGIKAARFLKSFQEDYTAVRPLTLLLKCCLKQRNLADVAFGGLGSWSLVNMVIAHLMVMDKQGEQVDHLGCMLLSFLQRYGVDFDRDKDAVAVKRGGIVARSALDSRFQQRGKLALEDPLTGREVAGGSHRYADVQETCGTLHQRLTDSLAAVQQQQGRVATSSRAQQGRSSSKRRVFDDDADEWGYDAANRSPTYQASIRQRQGNSSSSSAHMTGLGILDLLLDTKSALDRPGADGAATAGREVAEQKQQYVSSAAALLHGQQRGNGQWQWADGRMGVAAAAAAGGYSGQAGVGYKRGRW